MSPSEYWIITSHVQSQWQTFADGILILGIALEGLATAAEPVHVL